MTTAISPPPSKALARLVEALEKYSALTCMRIHVGEYVGSEDDQVEYSPTARALLQQIEQQASLLLLDEDGRPQHWDVLEAYGYQVREVECLDGEVLIGAILTPNGYITFS